MSGVDRMVVWLRETMDAAQLDAEAATPGPWHVTAYAAGSDYGFDAGIGTAPGEVDVVGHGYEGGGVERVQDARHIARHDPHSVLRRITADRATLDLHRPEPGQHPDFCGYDKHQLPCPGLRLLAEGYGWTEETQTGG